MPEIGEIKLGVELGYKGGNRCIWHACVDCAKERWVVLKRGQPSALRCKSCATALKPHPAGFASPNWKGGRVASHGYIRIRLSPDDFFYPMATDEGYVMEHRLIVAKALGRCLLPWEVVHHKQGCARDDNRYPQTLELITDKRFHMIDARFKSSYKQLQNKIKRLEVKVAEQDKQLRLLEWQIKEQRCVGI